MPSSLSKIKNLITNLLIALIPLGVSLFFFIQILGDNKVMQDNIKNVLGLSVNEYGETLTTTEEKASFLTRILNGVLRVSDDGQEGYFNKIRISGREQEPDLNSLEESEGFLWISENKTKLYLSAFGKEKIELLTDRFFNKDLTFKRNLQVNRNVEIGGNLDGETATLSSAYISGNLTVGGTSYLLGDADITGNLSANLGRFSNLGVTSAFSAATGKFSGNLSAASANITGKLVAETASFPSFSIAGVSFSRRFPGNNTDYQILNQNIVDPAGQFFWQINGETKMKLTNDAVYLDLTESVNVQNLYLSEGLIGTTANFSGNLSATNIGVTTNFSAASVSTNMLVLSQSKFTEGQLDISSGNIGSIRLRTINSPYLELTSPGTSAIINLDGVTNSIRSPKGIDFNLGIKATMTVSAASRNIATEATSDIRLKDGVSPIEDAISKLAQLRGVYYNWRTDINSSETLPRREFGFIAQEIETQYPELTDRTSEGLYTLDYAKFTALLVEGVKEQQTQIENLSNAIGAINLETLQSNFDDFKSALDSLSLSTGAGSLIVNSNFNVTGNSLFNNASFTGDVEFGQVKIDSLENDIGINASSCVDMDGNLDESDCDTNKLNIMKNKAGNVEMFDGKVKFKPNGEVLGEKVQAKTFKNTNTTTPSGSCSTGEFKFAEDSGKSYIYYCNSSSDWVRTELSGF
jgi:hypothetical protein